MPTATPTIFISAGEPSGDKLAAEVARSLTAQLPNAQLVGVTGPDMRSAGVTTWQDNHTLAHMGLLDILQHGVPIWRAYRSICRALRENRPDLAILVDCPELNLRLARVCHELDIPVLYFIPPKWWAWNRKRIHAIERYVDIVASVLPFEEAHYAPYNVRYQFVGHPMAWQSPTQTVQPIPESNLTIGMLPGSRRGEIQRHLPLLLQAAHRHHLAKPGTRFRLSLANSHAEMLFDKLASQYAHLPIDTETGSAAQTIQLSDFIWCASGTATLEVALAGKPMVIFYRMDPVSAWLAQRLVKIPYVGLPNLIFGRSLVPELLLDDATPEALVQETLARFDDRAELETTLEALATTRECMTNPQAPTDQVARLAMDLLQV